MRAFAPSLLTLAMLSAVPPAASAVTIDWVVVGDADNAPDTLSQCNAPSCGSVAVAYRIGEYEVTNAQYAEFLNAKASSDPLALYHTNMASDAQGGIVRDGSPGSYTYTVKPGFDDKPVNMVTFYDALRFTNWLNNGQGYGDTETGAYTLLGGTPSPSNGLTVTRNPGAIVFLPNENEWYKAAYFDGTSYLDFPAGSNATPACAAPTAAPNSANCDAPGSDATDPDVDGLTDVGSFPASASPYGTFDQGGNVYEWTEEIVEGFRVVRGGSWRTPAELLGAINGGELGDGGGFPTGFSNDRGFRVASVVPEPGTALLLGTGLLGLAARGRRH